MAATGTNATTVAVMMGRTLTIAKAKNGVGRTSFEQLCGQPLGAADYMALTEHYHALVLDDVPRFSRQNSHQLRRFITLVDLLYHLPIYLPACPPACPHVYLSVCLPVCLISFYVM